MKGHDYTLCLLCEKWDNNTKRRKMNESRLEKSKHTLSFSLRKSCHATYVHAVKH
jgi:hypothetical protein